MPNYVLEGDSFFVLDELKKITKGKSTSFFTVKETEFSFFDQADYNIYFEINKDTLSQIEENFIICIMDKNLDHRLDYVKKLKTKAEFICFDPIPTTDFKSLHKIFPKLEKTPYLPSKNISLKYKGSKQNYEWYDISLVNDLYQFNDVAVYQSLFDGFFDIWAFSDALWDQNESCLEMIEQINSQNFEDYFNRIR
jgi:hypothetical protein